MRTKGGIMRTSFYPIISQFVTEYKLYNHYLKPQQFTDPLDEYHALRTVAGLWDVTGEEVIEVTGPEALDLMNDLVPRDVETVKNNRGCFCILCNEHGGIIEDGVLIRFSPEKLWWVGGEAPTEQWIYGKALDKRVHVQSFFESTHVASVQGPRSRDILQAVCAADLSSVPYYGVVPETRVCGVPVTISRTGFTGELGFDIYVDAAQGERLYHGLWEAGRPFGMQLCGSRSMNVRRIEAAILNVGQDFDWKTTPYEANLEWMVDLRKPSFIGRDALAREAERPPARRIAGLRCAGTLVPDEGDAIYRNDQRVGVVTSSTLSPTLQTGIALAMVSSSATEHGTRLMVCSGDRRIDAEVVPLPFVDPERRLPKI